MFTIAVNTLLQQKLPQLPRLLCARSLRHDLDEVMALAMRGGHLAVVDDADTSTAFGDALCRAFKGRYTVTRIGLGRSPHADNATVESIRRQSAGADMLVAVGSGTVNDLCKYASHQDAKPYVVFPTAATMNGYLSANASITVDGYKSTLPAHLPQAVFCDMSVIAAAPPRLNKSGLGDSLARPTAQADWLLSHLLLATPYDDTPFALLKDIEPELFASARGIPLCDPKTLELLMHTLLLSGLGMTIAGGSYPASQSEHMIAHAYEMLVPDAPLTLHGEQIGVTTLAIAARQQRLLRAMPELATGEFPQQVMETHFGAKAAQKAKKEFRAKQERMEEAGLSGHTLKARMPDIAHRLGEVALPPAAIAHVLKEAQSPARHEDLGWTDSAYDTATTHARYLRDRFTCLDFANPG